MKGKKINTRRVHISVDDGEPVVVILAYYYVHVGRNEARAAARMHHRWRPARGRPVCGSPCGGSSGGDSWRSGLRWRATCGGPCVGKRNGDRDVRTRERLSEGFAANGRTRRAAGCVVVMVSVGGGGAMTRPRGWCRTHVPSRDALRVRAVGIGAWRWVTWTTQLLLLLLKTMIARTRRETVLPATTRARTDRRTSTIRPPPQAVASVVTRSRNGEGSASAVPSVDSCLVSDVTRYPAPHGPPTGTYTLFLFFLIYVKRLIYYNVQHLYYCTISDFDIYTKKYYIVITTCGRKPFI